MPASGLARRPRLTCDAPRPPPGLHRQPHAWAPALPTLGTRGRRFLLSVSNYFSSFFIIDLFYFIYYFLFDYYLCIISFFLFYFIFRTWGLPPNPPPLQVPASQGGGAQGFTLWVDSGVQKQRNLLFGDPFGTTSTLHQGKKTLVTVHSAEPRPVRAPGTHPASSGGMPVALGVEARPVRRAAEAVALVEWQVRHGSRARRGRGGARWLCEH